MTMDAIAHARLAVAAAHDGDAPTAQAHLAEAGRHARRNARRDRQIIEIATLVLAGGGARAAGLAAEHIAAFPEDADLLVGVGDARLPQTATSPLARGVERVDREPGRRGPRGGADP